MKSIKVSIQDEHTLVLQEDGLKGDLIDLSSIHETDIDSSNIASVVRSIQTEEFKAQLQKETANIERQKVLEARLTEQALVEQSNQALAKKEQQIAALNVKLETIARQTEADIRLKSLQDSQRIEDGFRQQLSDKEAEISDVRHKKELDEAKLKDQLRSSETALVSLKEMRSRMSTKMMGESLELHCENEFNKLRPIAFPNAEFNKDNTVSSSGSKGDYIYRET
ncbi:MAG: DUF2130 domain-containing protein, partial [Candidatus Saccharibacteria bacterium]